jgi:hypothetical protein
VDVQDADANADVLTAPPSPDPILYGDFVTTINGTEVVHPSMSVELRKDSWLYPLYTQVASALQGAWCGVRWSCVQ